MALPITPKTLIRTTFALFILLLILARMSTAKSQTTTSFSYKFDGEKPTTVFYQGDATFPWDSNYLRLTKIDYSGKALPNSAGRVLSDPIPFWESGEETHLQTNITFYIWPTDNTPADGIVFFIAPVGTAIPDGATGGNFGVFGPDGNAPNVFAAEFDIFPNGWDPDYIHLGIDLESRNSVNTTMVPKAELPDDKLTLMVEYRRSANWISVQLETGDGTMYRVSHEFDLTYFLPNNVQVGIAASTGEGIAVHDVVSWEFKCTIGSGDETMSSKRLVQ